MAAGQELVLCPRCNTPNHIGQITPGSVPVCSDSKCQAYLPWVVKANDLTLMEELKTTITTLIAFTATWCGPCKELHPVVEDLAARWPGRLKVIFVDVDESPGMTHHYQVMGVPRVIVGRAGQLFDTIEGALPLADMVQRVGQFV